MWKEFKVLFDLEIKRKFYDDIDKLVSESAYTIIASAIQKERYIKRYGKLNEDVYEIALSLKTELEIIIEKRGKKEDRQLETDFLTNSWREARTISLQQESNDLGWRFLFMIRKITSMAYN